MRGKVGRIGLLVMTLLAILPLPAWAGSSQAALAVGVVVPARCAVRMPDSLAVADGLSSPSRGTVAMRCTKGALPSTTGASVSPHAAGPRITRDLVLSAGAPIQSAPQPLAETGMEAMGPRLIFTVNF
jgi:hypothetical protein